MKYVIGFVVGISDCRRHQHDCLVVAARGPQLTTSFANVDALSKWMHYYLPARESPVSRRVWPCAVPPACSSKRRAR